MRSIYKKPLLLLSTVISICARSCLKDKDFDKGLIQSVHSNGTIPKVIEVKLTATNTSNFFSAAFDNSETDTVVDLIPVNLATADPAPEDIHVTLTADPDL